MSQYNYIMDNLLGIYEKALPNVSWEDKFNIAKQNGFDFIELSVDINRLDKLDYTDKEINNLLSLSNKYNMPFKTLTLSANRYHPIGDIDEREKGIELIKKAIILSKKLGIEIIQLTAYDVYKKESDLQTQRLFKEAIEEVLVFNNDYNITLAIEVLEDVDHFNTSDKLCAFIKEINNPYLKEYGDTGNLVYNGFDPVIDIQNNIEHMVSIHIKDAIYKNEHNIEYGKGEVDFEKVFNVLKQNKYKGYLVSECWYEKDYHPDLKYINEFIRSYMK